MTSLTPSAPVEVGLDSAIVESLGRAVMVFALGPPTGGEDRATRLNAAADALHRDSAAVAWVRQIHGSDLVEVGSVADVGCVGEADGLVTARPAHAVAVWTADCVPVLVAGRKTVAAVHAGWRGCAAGIVEAAIEQLWTRHGSRAEDLDVRLGPAIGPDHYEVGAEVVAALSRRAGSTNGWLHPGSRVDLRAYLRGRLTECGVAADRIADIGGCTACDPRTASYRRDGEHAGRQWSMVLRSSVTDADDRDSNGPGAVP